MYPELLFGWNIGMMIVGVLLAVVSWYFRFKESGLIGLALLLLGLALYFSPDFTEVGEVLITLGSVILIGGVVGGLIFPRKRPSPYQPDPLV